MPDESAAGNGSAEDGKKVVKTSVACTVCRQKRQKCDGIRPTCTYCQQNKLECAYSDKQKKRGPAPGYLARLSDRTKLLECFLGFMSLEAQLTGTSGQLDAFFSNTMTGFVHAVQDGKADEKEWNNWAGVYNNNFGKLADLQTDGLNMPSSLEAGGKAFKRPRSSPSPAPRSAQGESSNFGGLAQFKRESSVMGMGMGMAGSRSPAPASPFTAFMNNLGAGVNMPDMTGLSEPAQPVGRSSIRRRLSSGATLGDASSYYEVPSRSFPSAFDDPNRFVDINPVPSAMAGPGPSTQAAATRGVTFAASPQVQPEDDMMQDHIEEPEEGEEDMMNDMRDGPSTAMDRQTIDMNYTSGFWRDVDTEDVARSPRYSLPAQSSAKIQLPPDDVQNHLIETYFLHIHPQFPLLDEHQLRNYANREAIRADPNHPKLSNPPSRILMLALCAYSTCFSPTLGGAAAAVGALGVEHSSAGGVLADIWYEEARTTLFSSTLRRRCGIDTVQTIVLMAMREHGRSQDYQAWLLLGIAIRISYDLGLHISSRQEISETTSALSFHRGLIWRCICVLDLLIAAQLGRPTAVEFSDRETALRSQIERIQAPGPRATLQSLIDQEVLGCFDAMHDLGRIMRDIQRTLYLQGRPEVNDMLPIQQRLSRWYATLPDRYRIQLGQKSSLNVVTLHLLHQTATLLLYRPFQRDTGVDAVSPIISSTTMFNSLFDVLHRQLAGPTTIVQCQPIVVYMVVTIAIGFLSVVSQLKSSSNTYSAGFSAQLALLNCIETLEKMSPTWPLARRCRRTLEKLFEAIDSSALAMRPKRESFPSTTSQLPIFDFQSIAGNSQTAQPQAGPSRLSRSQSGVSSFGGANYMQMNGPPSSASYTMPLGDDLFPSNIEDLIGTTGWAMPAEDDFAAFDFGDVFGDGSDILDPNIKALMNGLGNSGAAQPFLVQMSQSDNTNGAGQLMMQQSQNNMISPTNIQQQPPNANNYLHPFGTSPPNGNGQGTINPSSFMQGSGLSNHALDMLAQSAMHHHNDNQR